jgi:hypothetical protein
MGDHRPVTNPKAPWKTSKPSLMKLWTNWKMLMITSWPKARTAVKIAMIELRMLPPMAAMDWRKSPTECTTEGDMVQVNLEDEHDLHKSGAFYVFCWPNASLESSRWSSTQRVSDRASFCGSSNFAWEIKYSLQLYGKAQNTRGCYTTCLSSV